MSFINSYLINSYLINSYLINSILVLNNLSSNLTILIFKNKVINSEPVCSLIKKLFNK
jgi:hypothetical protein